MQLNIMIFEDQPAHAKQLIVQMQKWAEHRPVALHTEIFSNGLEVTGTRVCNADLIFFDIELPGLNGLEAARKARQYSKDVPIVFCTNHQQYVFDGYKVQAFRYLLKPISKEDCDSCMEQALRFAASKQIQHLLIQQKGVSSYIPIDEILYIEAKGHYCSIVTVEQTIRILKDFGELQKELPALQFIQCHRSFLLNVKHILAIENNQALLEQNVRIPISRNYRTTVIEAFAEN